MAPITRVRLPTVSWNAKSNVYANPASLALHTRLGFSDAGRFHEAGRKFDQWLDVAYLELLPDTPQD